ncbi:MAG: hypothetical protein QN141_09305 [Armatimonadota bacterium]|nr:hypothetical protein [Armatimonadota bacterium]MDR7452486.1 hypothetical protein [Armatimonadota bacterium]MDR7467338.1 hypothetical protein [Armatimonadota bacterium]MDR7494109.1 hypothetical protein [Armatimonadota bacterium]MDR7498924.1 hypothetical protein [Armatimonadota bacterium]
MAPLADVLPHLSPAVADLIARGAPGPQVFRAVLEDLTTIPRLAVFEDIHWADEATLDLLRFVGRRIERTRTLLVATFRDDEVGAQHPLTRFLGDLATGTGTRRLTLPPLTPAAVAVLVRGSGLDAAALHRRTGGNPFYVTEILASPAPGIPPTVRDAVLARVSRLSAGARAALEIIAVIGPRAEMALVRDLAADPAGFEEGVTSGMLRAEGQILTFRHELARQAVLDSLLAQRRAALHGAVLRALLAHGEPDAARVADHAEAAGEVTTLAAWGAAAARRARTLGAHREAAAQFERVLRAAPLAPRERATLLFEYAEEAAMLDRVPEALRAMTEATDLWRALGDMLRTGEGLARQSVFLVSAGRNPEGEAALAAALELLEALPPGIELARAYRMQAYLRMLNRDNDEAIVVGQTAVELARRLEDTPTIVGAYNAMGSALLLSGRIPEGIAQLEASLRLAREAGLEGDVALAYVNLGSALGEVYAFPEADRDFAEGIVTAWSATSINHAIT